MQRLQTEQHSNCRGSHHQNLRLRGCHTLQQGPAQVSERHGLLHVPGAETQPNIHQQVGYFFLGIDYIGATLPISNKVLTFKGPNFKK
jgi:hypothetical protein